MIFTVDGLQYTAFVTELSRKATVKESKLSGDVKSGEHFRDIIGTYYDYTMKVGTDQLSETEYDALYELLTSPVESHTVILPYGRSTLEFVAYIDSVSDTLKSDRNAGRNWTDLSISFHAKKPQRRPT